MFKTLKRTMDIDISYSVNSFIYLLRQLPILEDLITTDIYSSRILKKIISFFVLTFFVGRAIFLKFMYFFMIFIITYKLFPNNLIRAFYHIYFTLTILGLFINNKLLNTSKSKYFGIFLFNIDATKYFKATIFWNTISNLILNSACLLLFGYLLNCPVYISIILIIYTLFVRFIGETINIMFYKKYNYIWYSNTTLYFIVIFTSVLLCLLPFINIFISFNFMRVTTIILSFIGIISLNYLLKIKDYKIMYKNISQVTNVMNNKNEKDYLKQAMVSLNKKDTLIDIKKIQGKKGYDLFNTIFFERHKEILLRSAKKYSFIFLCIYIFLIILVLNDKSYATSIGKFLSNNLGWFIIIMFFINRGAIITQAMFFNCDHAMLNYNFYREPNAILGLFKKRLLTVIKVNLLPATIIGVGNIILLKITSEYNIIGYISTFLFIITLSIFFSVHYLVIYYLLQPFNKEMEVKRTSYSFVTMFTYLISYTFTDLVVNSVVLSIVGLIFSIFYILLALILVNRFAPKTFKLN